MLNVVVVVFFLTFAYLTMCQILFSQDFSNDALEGNRLQRNNGYKKACRYPPQFNPLLFGYRKLCFKQNDVLLVLVYNSCFTTPYPQPSEHHEWVFHKNNRKSPLY